MTGTMTTQQSSMENLLTVAESVQRELVNAEGVKRTIAMATGLVAIRDSMGDDVLATLSALQNSPMGFRTDSSKGYPAEVLRDCCTHALLHGAYLVDDEFQIIAGQCYLGQKFYMRKLREYPGVSDVQVDVEIPTVGSQLEGQKGNWVMLVGGYASCNVDGKKVEVYARKDPKFGDSRIAVTAFNRGIDMAQGKAKKRLYQKLYERVAGVEITEGEGEVILVEPEPERSDEEMLRDNVRSYGDQAVEIGRMIVSAPTPEERANVLTAAFEHKKAGDLKAPAYEALRRLAEFHGLPDAESAA